MQPTLKVTETQVSRRNNAVSVRGIFLAALAVVAVVTMIYSQVEISEISAQINSSKAQLEVDLQLKQAQHQKGWNQNTQHNPFRIAGCG